jgi:hypothetical protein
VKVPVVPIRPASAGTGGYFFTHCCWPLDQL